MNDFKDKLRDYKIQPSSKAWEKIESALDKDKKSSAAIIYFRWAAAASVAMLITSYAVFHNVPMGAGVAETRKIENKTELANVQNSPTSEAEKIATTTKETINERKGANNIQSKKQSHRTDNKLPAVGVFCKPVNDQNVAEINYNQTRNNATLASLNTLTPVVSFSTTSKLYPQLPEFSTALIEDARIHRKWMNLLSEDLTEERDSTMTERALDLANKKTVTLFQSNIKPMLLDWYRSRIKL